MPALNTSPERTGASMQRIADLLAKVKATLWINHDRAQRDMLKMAPAYYGMRRWIPALFALGLVFVVLRAPGSEAPRAQSPRPAISRSGGLGGADYRIEVPENWSGGLVVYAHGIQYGTVTEPPIGIHILDQGHAWVASGYRAREYQPHLLIEDLVALRELFLQAIGQPRWTIVYGQSMGGHIVVASLELRPGLYHEDVLAPDRSRLGLKWTPTLHVEDPLAPRRH